MPEVILERWTRFERVERRHVAVDLTHPEKWRFVEWPPSREVDGWFAFYEGRMFAVVPASPTRASEADTILFDKSSYQIAETSEVKHASGLGGRSFELRSHYGSVATFRYRQPWRYLLKPGRLVRDVLLESDWWGLENDLPNWVHSTLKQRSLSEALSLWNERRFRVSGSI